MYAIRSYYDMLEMSQRLGEDPAVATSLSLAGIPNANQGLGIAVLKPWSQRDNT